jgi:hypothetical protein
MFFKRKTVEPIPPRLTGKVTDMDCYIHEAYDHTINYYWRSSAANKKNYKAYRSWTIILGALVTLVAALNTAEFIASNTILSRVFMIGTPALAATLTIINGLSQNFQWGATWRDMVVNAQRLEHERNRFLFTEPELRNYQQELEIMNGMVLDETRSFFKRVLDSEVILTKTDAANQSTTHS